MKTGSLFPAAAGAAIALMLTLGTVPAQLSAQAAQSPRDAESCRCVDRDGNEIERCTCFRAPNVEMLLGGAGWAQARPRLGISLDPNQSARRDAEGVLVTEVMDEGPADDAGLRRGDLITAIDGRSVFEPLPGHRETLFDLDRSVPVQRLTALLEELEEGQQVEIEYLRDGERRTTTIVAEELSTSWGSGIAIPRFDADRLRGQLRGFSDVPMPPPAVFEFRREGRDRMDRDDDVAWHFQSRPRADVRVFGGNGAFVLGHGPAQGLELVELNPALGAYFGAEAGVLVADVSEGSALGLLPGDVVLRIGDRDVETPDRLRRVLASYTPDEEIRFLVRRDGREIEVTGRLER